MDVAFNEDASDLVDPLYNSTSAIFSPQRKCVDPQLVACNSEVYEPCDDTFALVDALLADRAHLRELRPHVCLEVGSGSGYVITSLALMLGDDNSKVNYIATDISEAAVKTTIATLAAHHVTADVYVADLVSGIDKHIGRAVDVLVFNPPCLPTLEQEVGLDAITSAWAGGDRGRIVIDRMLDVVDSILSSKGWFYLVTITANNPGEICQIMQRKGFASRIVVQRYTDEESLHVLKFWRELAHEPSESMGSISPSSNCASALHVSLTQRLSRLVPFK